MTPEINDVLSEVRRVMESKQEKLEENKGPETPEVGPHSHLAGEPGVGEADNISDANDAVDKFIADIVDQLILAVGMEEEEAFDYVFDFLDRTSDDEHLPPLPGDDADPEELATWLGKATTLGVAAKILKTARGA